MNETTTQAVEAVRSHLADILEEAAAGTLGNGAWVIYADLGGEIVRTCDGAPDCPLHWQRRAVIVDNRDGRVGIEEWLDINGGDPQRCIDEINACFPDLAATVEGALAVCRE